MCQIFWHKHVFLPSFGLQNYIKFFSTSHHTDALLRSVQLAGISTVISCLISWPLAFFLAFFRFFSWLYICKRDCNIFVREVWRASFWDQVKTECTLHCSSAIGWKSPASVWPVVNLSVGIAHFCLTYADQNSPLRVNSTTRRKDPIPEKDKQLRDGIPGKW